MVNTSESSINVVSESRPKMLIGRGQNGTVVRTWDSAFPRHGHTTLPANRGHLTRPVNHAERGKPIPFLLRKVGRSQGQPIAVWVWGWEKANAPL